MPRLLAAFAVVAAVAAFAATPASVTVSGGQLTGDDERRFHGR